MPIGEFIGEVLLRGVFEIVFYTIFYYTGYPVVLALTFGRIDIAPISTIDETNKDRNRWTDWGIWLNRGGKRMLKAECTCLVGMIFWILIGIVIYINLSQTDSEQVSFANSLPAVVLR